MDIVNLRGFLSEGNIIRTKLSNSLNWVTNMVYSISEDCIEIDVGLEKTYIDSMIMKGDTIECKFTTNSTEYMLFGEVTRIKPEFPQSITIRVQKVCNFDNKRDSYRFDVNLSSVIKSGNKNEKGIFAILVNISRTGAAFVLKEDIEKLFNLKKDYFNKALFYVDIYTSPDSSFSFEGIIVRKKPLDKGVEYGLRITGVKEGDEKNFNMFLTYLANQDKEFYNKRSGYCSGPGNNGGH